MNEPVQPTETQQLIAEMKRQNIWLQKVNEKLALFLILWIIGGIITIIF